MKRLSSLLLLALPAAALHAQLFRASVRDEAGRPLSGVDVSIPSLKIGTQTDSLGEARLVLKDKGSFFVRARKLGYTMATDRAQVFDDTTLLQLKLLSNPLGLDTVKTVATANCARREFSGFECRRQGGVGTFLDYVSIDSAHVDLPGQLFHDFPGFRVAYNAKGEAYPEASASWHCVTILVNGNTPSNANRMPVRSEDLLGVEIYSRPEDVPQTYKSFAQRPVKNVSTRQTPLAPIPSDSKERCSLVNYWVVNR
jgi:hypothetical protein